MTMIKDLIIYLTSHKMIKVLLIYLTSRKMKFIPLFSSVRQIVPEKSTFRVQFGLF